MSAHMDQGDLESELSSGSVAPLGAPAALSIEESAPSAKNGLSPARFDFARYCAYVSALSFFLGSACAVAFYTGAFGSHPTTERSTEFKLDQDHIQELWKYRSDTRAISFAISMLLALGWFMMIPPILCLTSIFGPEAGSRGVLVNTMFSLGAGMSGFEFLFILGLTTGAEWITNDTSWNLVASDWRALEIAYTLVRAQVIWVFALDFLFMCIGFWGISSLVYSFGRFKRWWAHFGFVAGLLSFVAFVFDLLRLVDPVTAGIGAGLIMLFLGVIGLPIFLISLGSQLGRETTYRHERLLR